MEYSNRFKNVDLQPNQLRMQKAWVTNAIENFEDMKQDVTNPEDTETINRTLVLLNKRLEYLKSLKQ